MLIESRSIQLTTRTGVSVDRTIPHAKLKTIGAWCFIDHFGPTEQTDGMVVAAHPHTGLQTVTWLFEGEVEHRDSIGSVQLIKPGQLNLMTAGNGISHSEHSLATTEFLHAVQLWVALPKEAMSIAPAFEHQDSLPTASQNGLAAKVLIGEFLGVGAPTTSYSDMVGAELRLEPGRHVIPARSDYEYGILLVTGDISTGGDQLPLSGLKYFAPGELELVLETENGALAMLVGGVPFGERILMWWNFIGRNHEDIALAREQWNARDERFGQFEDNIGGWIPAPELPSVRLSAR